MLDLGKVKFKKRQIKRELLFRLIAALAKFAVFFKALSENL